MTYPAKILSALHDVMGKVGYVQKKGKNDFQKYRYAGEGNLLEVLRPAMVDAGLMLLPSQKTVSAPDEHGITTVCVEYTLAHKDGDVWPEKLIAYGTGGDKNSKGIGDKGLYKAATGANKYLLFKLFQIETGDDPEKPSEHDKEDDTPSNAVSAKSPPGITAAKAGVTMWVRELQACGDTDSFEAVLANADFKGVVREVYTKFPSEWTGPEQYSGLRGQIEFVGKQLRAEATAQSYLVKVEKALRQKEAA
jgi:hypothetical protein